MFTSWLIYSVYFLALTLTDAPCLRRMNIQNLMLHNCGFTCRICPFSKTPKEMASGSTITQLPVCRETCMEFSSAMDVCSCIGYCQECSLCGAQTCSVTRQLAQWNLILAHSQHPRCNNIHTRFARTFYRLKRNASLVVCLHGCATACSLKKTFAQRKIFSEGTLIARCTSFNLFRTLHHYNNWKRDAPWAMFPLSCASAQLLRSLCAIATMLSAVSTAC